MASNNIFIYELTPNNHSIASDIYHIIKESPEDENCYFNLQLMNENELMGEFITVQNVTESYYNPALRIFEQRIAPRATVIKFDVLNNRLEIWGSKANANRLVFTLSNMITSVSIKLVEFSLQDIIRRLRTQKVKICKVCFEDFLFAEDIVGSFNVDLSAYGDAFSVLNKYQDKIARLTINMPCNDSQIKVSLTSKGSVTVYKTRDLLDDESINLLHDILLKKGE